MLAKTVAKYLSARELLNDLDLPALSDLLDMLHKANLDELVTENNSLTHQNLWTPNLIDYMYDEFLKRIDTQASWCIMTSWEQEWIPYAVVWIGFEDGYSALGPDGRIILKPSINIAKLTNDDVPDLEIRIIHMLIDSAPVITFEVTETGPKILSLTGLNDRIEIASGQPGSRRVQVNAQLRETPMWNMVRRIYQGLRTGVPVIFDPYQGELIRQLVDLDEAKQIVSDRGITFEGTRLLVTDEEA